MVGIQGTAPWSPAYQTSALLLSYMPVSVVGLLGFEPRNLQLKRLLLYLLSYRPAPYTSALRLVFLFSRIVNVRWVAMRSMRLLPTVVSQRPVAASTRLILVIVSLL